LKIQIAARVRQRQAGNGARRQHARLAPKAIEQRGEERGRALSVGIRRFGEGDGGRQDPVRLIPGIDGERAHEAFHHEAGAERQHDRHGDLASDQYAPQPLA
jgi:hypothetical protein